MSLVRSIAKNVSFQIAGRVIGTAFGLITLALLTRYLGTSGYGEFTTASAYLQFVGVLVDFGLTLTAVQMLSEPGADERRVLGNLVTLRVITAVTVFALAVAVSLVIPWGGSVHRAIAVGTFSFVFLAGHQIFVGLFQRSMRMELSAIAEVVGRAGLLLGTVAVIALHGDISAVMIALGVGNLLMITASFTFARHLVPFKWGLDRAVVSTIVRRSWPMALSIVFNLIYLRGDMIILSLVRSQHEVGLYGAAYKPLDVITVLPMMFMGLILPLLVHAWSAQDHVRVARLLQRSIDAVSMLAFPVVLGGVALATPAMIFLAGNDFAAAGPLLALLTVAAGCVFFGSLFGHTIVALQRQRSMIWVYATDAVVCLGLYLVYIPRYGAVAGALITILSELVIAVGGGIIVMRAVRIRFDLTVPAKALGAALVMAGAVLVFPGVHVLIRVLLGAALYGALLLAFGAINRRDLDAIVNRKISKLNPKSRI
jgi:O-antigen/teichoic acid export membrane protein